jgi:ribosome biogenesis GTPase
MYAMKIDSADNPARETAALASIVDYGYDGAPPPFPGACAARVLGTWGDYYRIVCDAGEGVARKKASAFYRRPDAVVPTTGDFVALKWNPNGESRILATLPRRSKFERAAAGSEGRRAQTVAVNFDTLFFLTSANQNFNVRRIERFLSLGRASGAPVVVLLTKCDLVDAEERERLAAEAASHSGGATVHAISVRTGLGLDELSQYVRPRRTLAFIGSSGVGKSSLVNALAGEELMPTLEVREWDSKGRHTTTERELVRLPCGALVIDTPGMREIGMWEAETGISDAFADVEALFAGCRFSNCRHDTEPDCAVKAALANGTLPPERWHAYRRLKAESAREETYRAESTHRYRK